MADIKIRQATIEDLDFLNTMLATLAHHENRMAEFSVTPEQLATLYFSSGSLYRVYIVSFQNFPIAFMSTTDAYASFAGAKLLVLQELVIKPEFRRGGLGKALMAYLASYALTHGYAALKWLVLDSNASAVDFYTSIGASKIEGMSDFLLADDALTQLAASHCKSIPDAMSASRTTQSPATSELVC